jgi:hypothetical protein
MRCTGVVSAVMIKKLNGRESLLGLGTFSTNGTCHSSDGLLGRERPHHRHRPALFLVQEDVFTFGTKYHKQQRNHGLE